MRDKATTRFLAGKRLIVVAISACFASAPAWGNPTAPQLVNGNASFNQAGNLLTVNNSNGAIINWNTFSIAANETTRFNQASAASSVLNRVVTNDPSVLLGALSSNGKVWLVNPAGIMVGPGAMIDVAGFVGSTLNVRNEDFLAGRLNFGATPNAGNIQNYGQITTPSGGSVYLVAPNVENYGVINAPNGEVILAAGQTAQLIDTGTPGVKVEVTGSEGNATNLGEIVAEAGQIGMAGVLVRNSGTLNASSVVKEGGRIFLKANQDVAIGGASQIKTDGGQEGNGGNISVLAGGIAYVDGSISARGGSQSGDGGLIETSGAKVKIADSILVTTAAPAGHFGTWVIDPQDFTVAPSGGDMTGTALSSNLGTSNVTLQSASGSTAGSGNVSIHDTVFSWSANTTLTLTASNNVNIDAANITATGLSSGLVLNGNTANGAETASGTGSINITNSYVSIGGPVAVTGVNLNVGSAAAGATLQGGGMTATLSGSINVVAGSDTTGSGVHSAISSTGAQTLTANQILVNGGASGTNNIAQINAATQTLSANQILMTAGASGTNNDAMIYASGGDQQITLTGTAPLLKLTGGGSGVSDFGNQANLGQLSSSGAQTITINGGGAVHLAGGNGSGVTSTASPYSQNSTAINNVGTGTQTLNYVAGGSLVLTGGSQGSINQAQVMSSGPQNIVGAPSIVMVGGTSGTQNDALINSYNSTQNITASVLALTGGSGGTNNWSQIYSNGAQTVSASTVAVMGGSGSASASNWAQIYSAGAQSVSASGVMTLNGGSVGTSNWAEIFSTGVQTVNAPSITLTGGVSGGVLGQGNFAALQSQNSQSVTVGSGGMTLTAGGGGANNTDNYAMVLQNGGAGTSQMVNVSGGGSIIMSGGSSGATGVGAGHGTRALLEANGDSQTISFSGGGAINLTGGTAGSRAYALIYTLTGSQTISGSPKITMTGGASGGISTEGNYAEIYSNGSQSINASSIALTGGAGGAFNNAEIGSTGDQQISTSTSAGITIQGGAGTSYGNFAEIYHGTGSGNQAINVNGGGSVTLVGGSGIGTTTNNSSLVPSVCASDPSCLALPVTDDGAHISNNIGNQSLVFQATGGALSITGGSGGNRNNASISNGGTGTQAIIGFPNITLTGGASGGNNYKSTDGNYYLRNNAALFSPSGPEAIQANSLTLNGMSAGAAASTITSATLTGNGQNITVANAITLNSGTSANAYTDIYSPSGQSISAGSIALNAGTGAGVMSGYHGNSAQIVAYGQQNVTLTGTGNVLSIVGGGGAGGYDDNAGIYQESTTAGNQTITLQGANAAVTLQSGSGTGLGSTTLPSACYNASGALTYCDASLLTSHNNAFIRNNYGSQTIDFQQGGSLSLTGGANGVFNYADINNASMTGQQTITSSKGSGFYPSITLTGGASGGGIATFGGVLAYDAVGVPIYLRNDAWIESPNATASSPQVINAATMTLTGAGNSTTYGGALIRAPYQSIVSTGNVSLTAGAGDSATLPGLTTAFIGNSEGAANVQFSIGGSLALQGGTGNGSGALIGSRQFGATVSGLVANDITVTAGQSTSGLVAATIGSSEGHGGSVALGAGRDITFGDNTGVTSKPGAAVAAPMTVALGAGRDISLGQVAINPDTGTVLMIAGWNGNTTNPGVATVAPSGGLGGSIAMSGTSIQNAGAVSLEAYGKLNLSSISGTRILGDAMNGNLTLNSGASLSASGTGDALVLAAGSNFIDNAGATALSVPAGRSLVYSTNPTLDTRGGLAYNFEQYGISYTGTPYAGAGSGNGFIYSVTPTVTVSLTGTTSKVYDGTTTATLAVSNFVTAGALGNDTIVLDTPTTGSYADKNVGTGKGVSASVSLAGAYSGSSSVNVYGYQLANSFVVPPAPGNPVTNATTTATGNIGQITPATLTVSGLAAQNKVYDATTAATLGGTATLSGVIGSDVVTLGGGATASFVDKNVGTAKPVTVTSLSVSGTDAGNYTVVAPTGLTANITSAPLTVSATGQNKLYDSTTNATVSLSDNRLSGDVLALAYGSATFADPNAGTAIPVTVKGINVTGTDAGNYTFNTTASTTANITAAPTTTVATVINTVVASTITSSTTATTTAATSTASAATVEASLPPVPTIVPGVTGTSLLSDPNQTVGGSAGMFGGSSTPPAASSAASAPVGSATTESSAAASSGTGPSGQGDKPAAGKPADDKSGAAKKDEEKKKDEQASAKKESKPVAKKLGTCS